MEPEAGFEPATSILRIWRSSHLSYSGTVVLILRVRVKCLEPAKGFEPPTPWLQIRSSAIELHRHWDRRGLFRVELPFRGSPAGFFTLLEVGYTPEMLNTRSYHP